MVERDYPDYLKNNAGESQLPATNKANQYYLSTETRSFNYKFRSAMTGVANLWIVEIGKMLDDTLKSADVQSAFRTLNAVNSASAPGTTLTFELQNYAFHDFSAHISMNIKLMKNGVIVFEKNYTQDGPTQAGKMFFGGVFAQKNAVQQSTRLALDKILRQLITDLNQQQQ
jgi:hypothetical protein